MADELLEKIEKQSQVESGVPAGYVKIVMSTKGLYGAPEVLHMRNFSVEEALQLSQIQMDELPIKITSLLQNLIWEKDVNLSTFYDAEVSELLIHFYTSFYQRYLKEVKYDLTEEDKKWAKENIFHNQDSTEYRNWLRGVATGMIKLNFDIDLAQVKYYNVDPEKVHKQIRFTRSVGDKTYTMTFQYPRFGDAALLQKTINEKFKVKDRQFGPLYETYRRKQDMEQRLRKGEQIDPGAIPYIPEDDLKAVTQYELEKTSYVIALMRGLYLCELDGQDVSSLPLAERVEIAKDPRIDFSSYQTVSDYFQGVKLGPVKNITILNPVNGLPKEIEYPFRPIDLLANIKNFRPDNSTIEFI